MHTIAIDGEDVTGAAALAVGPNGEDDAVAAGQLNADVLPAATAATYRSSLP